MTRHACLLVAVCFGLVACESRSDNTSADTTATSEPTVTVEAAGVQPAILDKAQLAQLRWLEGTWRGTGGNIPSFYERYTFTNDSTMVMYSLRDSTGRNINDSSVYMLRDGHFSNLGDGPRWIVTAIGNDSVHFEPLARATNSFTWQRVDDNQWTARLVFPATRDRDASSRTYQMRRMRSSR